MKIVLEIDNWVEAMSEKFRKFKKQEIVEQVDFPAGIRAIRTKWIFMRKDDRGIVIMNKARLVT